MRKNEKFDEVEQLLRKVRLAEPSAELKSQIVGTAREMWEKAPADIPWRIPLRHLAVSVAAAVLIVWFADYYSLQAVTPWQANRPVAPRMQMAADAEDLTEMPYNPFVRHLMAAGRAPASEATALLNYVQRVRDTLNGAGQEETTESPNPGGPESRLVPVGSKIVLYS